MSKQYKLKDNHPTMIKLSKLFELAEDLNISISFTGHRAIVEDFDRPKDAPVLYLEDIESDSNDIGCFPPATEYKVVYSK